MEALNGLILAGGRSERMGSDKAALDYHGRMHAHHLAQLLAPFVARVFISVRHEQSQAAYLDGLTPVFDHYPSPSPLNGIVSALRAQPHTSLLVVAVDMPHIDAAAIQVLIKERDPLAVATCFESPVKGGPDPLFAIWEGHAFAQLEALLIDQTAHICPRKTLVALPTRILSGKIAARTLENINTPQELAALREVSECA